MEFKDLPVTFRDAANPGEKPTTYTFLKLQNSLGMKIQLNTEFCCIPFIQGFHEAIGDIIALSVGTPAHLKKVGLINLDSVTENSTINFLMQVGLDKVERIFPLFNIFMWYF